MAKMTTSHSFYYAAESKEDSHVNTLEVCVYYSKGGMNVFTYRNEPRGWYLRLAPINRTRRDGYITKEFVAYTGRKILIKECNRNSAKAYADALKYMLSNQRRLAHENLPNVTVKSWETNEEEVI